MRPTFLDLSRGAAGIPTAILVCLVAADVMILAQPALATVPPYAEEWSVNSSPEDVEVDPFGRVWVSCNDDTIRVYTATGGHLLFTFGGSGIGDGEFRNPYGIAFDPSGEAYICDYEGARVQKFTSGGAFLLSWPIPSTRSDHVAVDAAGDVYVTGFNDASVHKYTPAGVPLLSWASNGGSTTAGIVEANGTINVVQWDAPVVEQFMTDGTFLGAFSAGTLNGTDIEVDAGSQLWVADYGNNQLRIFTANGVPVDTYGSLGSGPGEFSGLIGLALGPDGSVYVADEMNRRVQRFGDPVAGVAPGSEAAAPSAGGAAITAIAPNPCRSGAQLTYSLLREEEVRLTVVDVHGRVVATLVDGRVAPGSHRIAWAARNESGEQLAAGVYFLRLAHGQNLDGARFTVVR